MLHSVLRVTTSSGVQVYKVCDIVKLDTKPIIYGKVMHFVKVSKKNDVDKVVVQRQPEEVCKDETIGVLLNSFYSKLLASVIETHFDHTDRTDFNNFFIRRFTRLKKKNGLSPEY